MREKWAESHPYYNPVPVTTLGEMERELSFRWYMNYNLSRRIAYDVYRFCHFPIADWSVSIGNGRPERN